jgi:hypothetical protein
LKVRSAYRDDPAPYEDGLQLAGFPNVAGQEDGGLELLRERLDVGPGLR